MFVYVRRMASKTDIGPMLRKSYHGCHSCHLHFLCIRKVWCFWYNSTIIFTDTYPRNCKGLRGCFFYVFCKNVWCFRK